MSALSRSIAVVLLFTACDDTAEPEAFVAFTVVFADAVSPASGPLAGVEVCVAERDDLACANSDADGRVTLDVPADAAILLRCERDTHGPAFMTWQTGDVDIDAGTFSLLGKPFQSGLVNAAGATTWPTTGAITANIYEDLVNRDVRVADATVTITPSAAVTYVSAERVPDPDLTASTLGGPAIFYDLADGTEVTLTISHPSRTCTGGFGWPTDDSKALRTRVYAGALTNVTFVCLP